MVSKLIAYLIIYWTMTHYIFIEDIDDMLAKHIAHLFIRDPLVLFSELIDQDDTTSMDHFEASNRWFFGRITLEYNDFWI